MRFKKINLYKLFSTCFLISLSYSVKYLIFTHFLLIDSQIENIFFIFVFHLARAYLCKRREKMKFLFFLSFFFFFDVLSSYEKNFYDVFVNVLISWWKKRYIVQNTYSKKKRRKQVSISSRNFSWRMNTERKENKFYVCSVYFVIWRA